jgi:hypothetical protein
MTTKMIYLSKNKCLEFRKIFKSDYIHLRVMIFNALFDSIQYSNTLDYEDFLAGKKIIDNRPIEQLLINLTPDELDGANKWYNALREGEKFNVRGVLTRIQDWQNYTNARNKEPHLGLVMIVAGSSILRPDYADIDLFLIPATYNMGFELSDRFAVNMIAHKLKVNNCIARFDEDTPYQVGEKLGNDEKIHGKQLTCFLLHDKKDFERQRKPGDLIYKPNLTAKELVELNREYKSDFEVLYRKG